jgi:hypothetical protein
LPKNDGFYSSIWKIILMAHSSDLFREPQTPLNSFVPPTKGDVLKIVTKSEQWSF